MLRGDRISLIPPKLAKKIVEGLYIDTAELCLKYLEKMNSVEKGDSKAL